MSEIANLKNSIDIFCNVLDNFGDAGVCLRLARDLSHKGFKVNLYCDHLETLNKIALQRDRINKFLTINQWDKALINYNPSYFVIQAFSCRINKNALNKIKEKHSKVINLEYLSAEKWVEDCHEKMSFGDGLVSYFFFPGFTKKTGGVIIENEFLDKVLKKQSKSDNEKRKVTLFSYPNKHVKEILSLLNQSNKKSEITVFEGLALDNINNLYNLDLKVGDTFKLSDKLTLHISAMVSQEQYDDLLLNSDFNLVRGEDSIVRAMLSGKPFLWQIYIQEDNAHIIKLKSFFDRLEEICSDKNIVNQLKDLMLFYNDAIAIPYIKSFDEFETKVQIICKEWSHHLLSLNSLSDNLIEFLKRI